MKEVLVNLEFTTIRSLIVLLFLVGLPIVAIMPDGVQGALKGFWPETEATPTAKTPPVLHPSSELASFPMAPQGSSFPASPRNLPPVNRLADFQTPTMSKNPPSELAQSETPRFETANFEVPSEVVSEFERQPSFTATANDPINDLPLPSDRLIAPTSGQAGLITRGTEDLQIQLDRLGATYYRLESWGASPRVYRFHCTVTIKIGLSEYSQRFEATAESPETAMRQVHAEVQSWHERFSRLSPAESMTAP